uniref:Uncharacterized protein n=1 Tax=Moniliophthora roreri TaxID=221103 RepID=A0A0W0G7J7_MONRR
MWDENNDKGSQNNDKGSASSDRKAMWDLMDLRMMKAKLLKDWT